MLPLEELQKDLEEVKVLLEKSTRKRLRDTLTSEKSKIETELKNKMQKKSQKKPELDNEKPAAVVVHQVPTENVQCTSQRGCSIF